MALNAPIQQHVAALAVERGYPRAAVEACLRQPGQVIPPLFALLQRAARGQEVDDAEAAQFFLGIHILAQLRYKPACAPLLRLLRGDVESLDYLLSDAVFETLPKLVASLYDDDADALFDMVADAGIDECIRDALWGAVGTLTFTDRISRETTVAFVTRYDDERLAPDADMGWCGWLEAIMVLGLADLVPRAEAVWSDGRLPEGTIDRAAFEEGLAAGVKGEPILPDGFGTIDDVATDLDWVDWERSDEPYVNPMRDVGRNDPCPCGSGKKAKKCCLAPA